MKKDNDNIERRALMTGMGVALAGLTVSSGAQAQGKKSGFEPARHDEDAWFDDKPSTHRVFIDSASTNGGTDAPRYAFNIMNSHITSYGGSDEDYSMIVCFRHMSTAFGYQDHLWEKYGEILVQRMMGYKDPATDAAPKKNLLNVASGPFSGATLDALTERGVRFAVCSAASRGLAGMIAGATGQDTDDVFAELGRGLIPNARFVPTGVTAATRSQEYGYSLLSAG
jgi:hypothetical protein